MSYLATVLVGLSVAVISAMALNVLVGYAGQLAVTQGALMGLGAYTVGILSAKLSVDPLLGMLLGAIVGGLAGLLFAAASLKLVEYDYVLVSLILQMMVIEVIRRWTDLTGGTSGLSGVAQPSLARMIARGPVGFATLTLIILIPFAIAMFRLGRSPYALALRGFRESEAGVAALGWNTTRLRLSVGLIAGVGAGLAGGIQASFIGFITPGEYTEFLSILVIVYLLVGGSGNMWGAILGVLIVVSLPELLTYVDLVSTAAQAPLERIIYGLIIIAFVVLRPQGLLPERRIVSARRRPSRTKPAPVGAAR